MKFKAYLLRLFLLGEIVIFGVVYFWGVDGVNRYNKICEENRKIEQDIIVLKKEVQDLEAQLSAWQTDPFYKEKVAREQLQMARAGEELFYIQ
jgi:cell division protein FtsB